MKILYVFLLLSNAVNGQDKPYEKRMEEAQRSVQSEALSLKDRMENSDEFYLNKELEIAFAVDTFKIEELMRKELDIDYSTYGMVQASMKARDGYDSLLNKYYKLLINRLNEEDQETLRNAQRNWIKFRDSEIALIGTLSMEEYSGGGTMQRIIDAGWVLDLTKSRALDVYGHLLRISEF